MTDLIDPTKLASGYLEKLKKAESEAKRLSRTAEKLRKQQATQDEKRQGLEEDVHKAQQAIAQLESERESLKGSYSEALFENDVQQQRDIAKRRTELDRELDSYRAQLETLRESLEALKPLDREAAKVAVDLDAINTGNHLAFINELRFALMKYEGEVNSTIADARKKLPRYSYQTLEAVREANDENYAERKAREKDELEQRRARESRQEAARAKNRTRHAVLDKRGVQTGWDIYENGVRVGYQEANWVEVS